MLTVMPIVVGVLGTVFKGLMKKNWGDWRSERRNREILIHIIRI